MSVCLNDFRPMNLWKVLYGGPKYKQEGEEESVPMWIKDESTSRLYLNESRGVVSFKCCMLSVVTPLVQLIASAAAVIFRLLKSLLLIQLWEEVEGETKYSFRARVLQLGQDLLKIVAAPLAIVGMELSVLYGIVRPYDGRKLYASIERVMYNNTFFLAPCFQPEATGHLLGGSVKTRDTF